MQTDQHFATPAVRDMPLLMAAELQDHLMTAANDLDRLQRLLDKAYEVLNDGLQDAAAQLTLANDANIGHRVSLQETLQSLYKAVSALQFQDLATQLIRHTNRRLRNCADQIARDAMGDDPDGETFIEEAPGANPLSRDDAGSVELF